MDGLGKQKSSLDLYACVAQLVRAAVSKTVRSWVRVPPQACSFVGNQSINHRGGSMLFAGQTHLQLEIDHGEWQLWGQKYQPEAVSLNRVGLLGRFVYEDDTDEVWILFEDGNYINPRAYVENAWAKGDILRVKHNLGDLEWDEGVSIPTKGIKKIYWQWVFGPRKNAEEKDTNMR